MSGVKYVSGETITFVDFMFWEWLDHLELFDETLFEDLKNLKSFKSRVASLPKVKEYLSSDRFMSSPLNGKMALWGGDKELKCPWEAK